MGMQAKKLTKLIILNYTERGKRQQLYNYCYIIFTLYTRKNKNKITQLFREAEPRKRLKDYQKIPIRTGDKIGCQHNDAWHGPAETINQKGNTILAYFNEEMRKVAMCRTKPHQQIERIKETRETENHAKIENNKTNETKIDDIIENNKIESEKENENDTGTGQKIDKIDAKHLQIEKSVYFMDYQIYPVEVPTKDHGKPVIIAVKSKELDNLNRIDFKKHENNGHTCKQCNSQYESREDLKHHKRIRHRQYNDEQINNYQENRRQLRNQTDRINLKKSKDNLDCRHDIEKQNNENNRYQYKCDLCNKSLTR